MEPVGRTKLWSFLSSSSDIQEVINSKVRTDKGHRVANYRDLAQTTIFPGS